MILAKILQSVGEIKNTLCKGVLYTLSKISLLIIYLESSKLECNSHPYSLLLIFKGPHISSLNSCRANIKS